MKYNKLVLVISNDNYFQPDYLANFIKILKGSKYKILKVFIYSPPKKKLQDFLLRNLFKLHLSEVYKLFVLKFFTSYINYFIKPKIKCFSLKKILVRNNIKFSFVKNINNRKIYNKIFKQNLIVVNTADQIFKKSIIKLFKFNIYNIHLSILPRYGGRWTMFQQMSNNEKFTGLTLHKINSQIDAGKIVNQKKFLLKKNYSLFENQLNCYKELPLFLKKSLQKGLKIKKIIKKSEYFDFPSNEDWIKFRIKKFKII